jgi:hypothetical protein
MAWLFAEERHRQFGRGRSATDDSGGAVAATGHVDGTDRNVARLHRLDEDTCVAVHRARDTSAEDCIDNHASAIEAVGREWRKFGLPRASGASGVTGEFFACGQAGPPSPATRRFHHRDTADVGGFGRAIGFAHLGGGQEREDAVIELSLGDHIHPPVKPMMAANDRREHYRNLLNMRLNAAELTALVKTPHNRPKSRSAGEQV